MVLGMVQLAPVQVPAVAPLGLRKNRPLNIARRPLAATTG